MSATTLYVIRHAQAQPLPTVPEPDWALSQRGETQAVALAPLLSALGITQVYCSPFRRCRDTLRPFTAAAGLELRVHPGLRERSLGTQWIGDFRAVWQRSWADFDYVPGDGESCAACRARMVAAVAEIGQRHPDEVVAIGSHGFAIGLLLTTLEATFGGPEASALRTPEILRLTHDGAALTWERTYSAGPAFDRIATDFRQTPGIVA